MNSTHKLLYKSTTPAEGVYIPKLRKIFTFWTHRPTYSRPKVDSSTSNFTLSAQHVSQGYWAKTSISPPDPE